MNAPLHRSSGCLSVQKRVKVRFELLSCLAHEVHLAGDFNGWDPQALPLENVEGPVWEVEIALSPGRHEYLFVVDGEWETDPAARSVPNDFGTRNSVIEVLDDGKILTAVRRSLRRPSRSRAR